MSPLSHQTLFFLLYLLPPLLALPSPADPILINCGTCGDALDLLSRTWHGDAFSPLLPPSTHRSTPTGLPSIPAVPYSTARIFSSPSTYPIPVRSPRYLLRLHFSPLDATFDVSCGPHALLSGFNPRSHARALGVDVVVREYSVNVSTADGWLKLTFTPSPGSYAFVNGIELVAAPDMFSAQVPLLVGSPVLYPVDSAAALETVYRLNVGGGEITPEKDSGRLYRTWTDDSKYIAGGAFGITFSKDDNVAIAYPPNVPDYIAPADVYATARSMPWFKGEVNLNYNMSWILPVDPGFYYLVRLHFCEIQYPFTMRNQRVFTVYVNNQTDVGQFDVISYSGGIGIPVYHDSVTAFANGNEQVDLWISLHPNIQFQPQYTNVILNGLEVFKLSSFSGNLAGPNLKSPYPSTEDQPKPITAESGNSNKGRVFAVAGALMLIGSLILFVCYAIRHALCNSWQSSKDTKMGSGASFLPSDPRYRFAHADIKKTTDVEGLVGMPGSDASSHQQL